MLPRFDRLRRGEVEQVLRSGVSIHGDRLSGRFYSPSGSPTPRFAVVVSKKTVRRAVERNKLRRRCYSILRELAGKETYKCWGVFFLKANARSLSFESLQEETREILIKAGYAGLC